MYHEGDSAMPKAYPQGGRGPIPHESDILTLGLRADCRVALALQVFKGYSLLQIRKRSVNKYGCEVWTKQGIALHPDEAQKLLELLPNLLKSSETQALGLFSRNQLSAPLPQVETESRITLQDRVLLHLASGRDPEDVRVLIFGESPGNRRRFTELGKSLRRCGLLAPRQWIPTPLGQKRANDLRREEPVPVNLEVPEEEVGKGFEIPPFPGGADLSDQL